jgi:hypothetical protein
MKTENRPRWVRSRYSCGDVGRLPPDLAAPFSVCAPIRIAPHQKLAMSFRYLHSNPILGNKRVDVKANCEYGNETWMRRTATFQGKEFARTFADLAGDVEAIKQRALELAQSKLIKTFDKVIAARVVAAGAAAIEEPLEKRQRSEPKKLVQGFKPNSSTVRTGTRQGSAGKDAAKISIAPKSFSMRSTCGGCWRLLAAFAWRALVLASFVGTQ